MSVQNIAVTVTIVAVECGECHVWFGLDQAMHAKAKETGQQFYCPNGHRIGYGDNENKRLKREAEAATRREQWANERAEMAQRRAVSAEMSRRVTKGHLTRIKKRVGAGVCPKCHRSFKQLAAHMQCKHPGYGA